jgi:hypothetical protein
MGFGLEMAEQRYALAHAQHERAKRRLARHHGKPATLETAKKELARAERELAAALQDVKRARQMAVRAS